MQQQQQLFAENVQKSELIVHPDCLLSTNHTSLPEIEIGFFWPHSTLYPTSLPATLQAPPALTPKSTAPAPKPAAKVSKSTFTHNATEIDPLALAQHLTAAGLKLKDDDLMGMFFGGTQQYTSQSRGTQPNNRGIENTKMYTSLKPKNPTPRHVYQLSTPQEEGLCDAYHGLRWIMAIYSTAEGTLESERDTIECLFKEVEGMLRPSNDKFYSLAHGLDLTNEFNQVHYVMMTVGYPDDVTMHRISQSELPQKYDEVITKFFKHEKVNQAFKSLITAFGLLDPRYKPKVAERIAKSINRLESFLTTLNKICSKIELLNKKMANSSWVKDKELKEMVYNFLNDLGTM